MSTASPAASTTTAGTSRSKTAVPCQNSYEYPQASACFIQSVKDTMEDIMRLAATEAMLFKYGSGTGTDLSTLRSSKEKLSGGGTPSGPLSFMRVFDQVAAVIKSGGKTRRAAKMQILKVDHPDIMEFITCKTERGEEGLGAHRRRLRRLVRRRSLRQRDVPELEPFRPRDGRVHAGGGERRPLAHPRRDHRREARRALRPAS